MLMFLIVLTESDSIIPEGTGERIVWAVPAIIILGLYYLMKHSRKKATEEYWARRRAEKDRIANDPDMRQE